MGKLHSKHGDSFAVNASLARRGLEDWMVKQKYSGGSSSGGSSSGLQHGCQHRAVCRLSSARLETSERHIQPERVPDQGVDVL
ncbi:hypothetical protein DV515_00008260 [Chloebia gouldiae]|uniref:Uncharacterized protein n=1 Tax=Chloebia gouldiae TaxID=44316 RepID=A0A3L8SFI0_CHLGU|nr:hypothetical protein DV515_00008260 [Chloebia gouldiae]